MKFAHRPIRPLFFLAVIASFVLAACGTSPQTTRVPRVGIINYLAVFDPVITGFKQSMTDAGFVEDKSVVYLFNGAVANDTKVIDQEIEKLSGQNPDLFLAIGSIPAARIKLAVEKSNKPVVFAPVTNPKAVGLVQDLLKPGGKMTGIDTGGFLTSKGLEWLLTVMPNIKRIHVFYLKGELLAPPQVASLQGAADNLKVELVRHEIGAGTEMLPIISSLPVGTDAVFWIASSLSTQPNVFDFVTVAGERGIPIGSGNMGAIQGVLTGLGIDYVQVGKQAGRLAQQILHGADPGTLPIEPVQYTLQVNMVTAKALGLAVSDSVLKQANDVILVNPTPMATSAATGAAASGASGGTPAATSSR